MNPDLKLALVTLWRRMGEIYGGQFANQYGKVGGEAFQTWCLGLRDVEPQRIRSGFARLLERESKFVPNLNEFRKLCTPDLADYGLPDVETAYQQACQSAGIAERWKTYGHDAVRLAARETTSFTLRSMPREKAFPLFKRNYEILCNRVIAGEALEDPIPKALPQTVDDHNPSGVSHKEGRQAAKQARTEVLSMVKGLKKSWS